LQLELPKTLLDLFAAQRRGNSIDQDSVGKILDSFVSFGGDLYKKHFKTPFLEATKGDLNQILQEVTSRPDDDFLKYYADEWGRYTTGASSYRNRDWGKGEDDESKERLYEVHTVR
jgi:hypothetical protein